MLFAIDLDGVIYRDNHIIKGSPDTIKILKKKGNKVVFITNNATLSRNAYVKKLSKIFGLKIPLEEVMCSAYATAEYIHNDKGKGKKVFVIGEHGLYEELENFKIKVLEAEDVDYLAVGLDRNFNYKKLLKAADAVRNGAKFIASNTDATYPGKDGAIYPGGGAIVKAIEIASSVKPKVIGKPQPYMLKKAMEYFKASLSETVVVGDRIDTDVLFGKNVGVKTCLVLTGVTNKEMLKGISNRLKPDCVFDSINDIVKVTL